MASQGEVRLVVDSNFLQDIRLKNFLQTSPRFQVVMTDYLWMEIYKADSNVSFLKALSILSNYPGQVVILKGTKAISQLSGRGSRLTSRMIQKNADLDVKKMFEFVRSNPPKDDRRWKSIEDHRRIALEHLSSVRGESEGFTEIFGEMQSSFSASELQDIRRNRRYSSSLLDKIFNYIWLVAERLFTLHPDGARPPRGETYLNTFIFRYSLCMFVLFMNWMRVGSTPDIAVEKITNDKIDANFASYGTYFSGVLSSDKKLNRLHDEARHILTLLGAPITNRFEFSEFI